MNRTRKILQISFLSFFFILFIRAGYPYEVSLESDLFLRFSPLGPLFYFIDSLQLPLFFWPALIILLLTPLLGRFFCGWICPLGTSLDIFSRLFKSPSNKISGRWVKLSWVKFAVLSASIAAAFFSLNIWAYFDPLGIFTRITTVIFHPVFTFITEKSLLGLTEISFLEEPVYAVYDFFKDNIMPEKQPLLTGIFGILLFAGLIFSAEKLSRRFWCRYLCPAGALLGFLSQFRFYERIVSSACPVCNKCQVECKMNAIPENNIPETSKVECIECFSCGAQCPPKFQSITYRWRWKPYHSKPDFSRRQFVASIGAGLSAFVVTGFTFPQKSGTSWRIRPPGALPEDDFLDKCMRCLECVRICESNGACLQSAGVEQNWLNLWTPVAKMREGYCEYNCNLCGQVCPTDAILPLTLDQKKQTAMGLAYFDKDLCIPFSRNEDCIVCEEHCPTPEKAIKFDIKSVELPDGTVREVKFPLVERHLCIGCGICEYKCPLPGKPGIFVISENEKRFPNLSEVSFETPENNSAAADPYQ